MTKSLTVSSHFSSAHFYAQPAWDAERNSREFGRCYTKYGHGHNYKVEATFESNGEALFQQPTEAMTLLSRSLHDVTDVLDHEHLNFVVPEFRTQVPTTENIALYIWQKLSEKNPSSRIQRVRLFEMNDLWVEVSS